MEELIEEYGGALILMIVGGAILHEFINILIMITTSQFVL